MKMTMIQQSSHPTGYVEADNCVLPTSGIINSLELTNLIVKVQRKTTLKRKKKLTIKFFIVKANGCKFQF